MNKILYATDFSENAAKAFPLALEIANKHDAELIMLHVFDIPTGWNYPENEDALAMEKRAIRESEEKLKQVFEQKPSDVRVKFLVVEKTSVVHGIEYVISEEKPELLVIGTKGESKIKELLVGSTTKRVRKKLDIREIDIPNGTTMFVLVNPNNPNGGTFDLRLLPEILDKYQETHFLIDEAFIGVAGQSVAHLVPGFRNLMVTRTFSKAHSLAGFRVGYAILPKQTATLLNSMNDAYPLARTSEAAAIATLQNEDRIIERIEMLKKWTNDLAYRLQKMGIRIFPTETYFFLADFAPFNAHELANGLAQNGFLIKALDDRVLGDGFVRITTSTPENNDRFIMVLKKLINVE